MLQRKNGSHSGHIPKVRQSRITHHFIKPHKSQIQKLSLRENSRTQGLSKSLGEMIALCAQSQDAVLGREALWYKEMAHTTKAKQPKLGKCKAFRSLLQVRNGLLKPEGVSCKKPWNKIVTWGKWHETMSSLCQRLNQQLKEYNWDWRLAPSRCQSLR